MELYAWTLFALTITVASVSPGPNVLIVIVNTLKHGAQGATWTILGNLSCLFCVALLASIGVGAVIATMPIAFKVMQIAGGLYLAWLGFKMIRASFGPIAEIDLQTASKKSKNVSALALAAEAFLVSASNPKSILFLTAVFPQFIDRSTELVPQFAIMFATIIMIVSLIHGGYAFLASTVKDRPISQRVRRWLQRLTGTTFIGLGAGVALAK